MARLGRGRVAARVKHFLARCLHEASQAWHPEHGCNSPTKRAFSVPMNRVCFQLDSVCLLALQTGRCARNTLQQASAFRQISIARAQAACFERASHHRSCTTERDTSVTGSVPCLTLRARRASRGERRYASRRLAARRRSHKIRPAACRRPTAENELPHSRFILARMTTERADAIRKGFLLFVARHGRGRKRAAPSLSS